MTESTIISFLPFTQPTANQITALQLIEQFLDESCKDDFVVLSGAAGTGKTSITTAVVNYLNEQEKPYKICAPTGRAARILGRKSNTCSSTIHSTIYSTVTSQTTGLVHFTLKEINDSDKKATVFIIDEASMVGTLSSTDDSLFQTTEGLLQALIKFCKSVHQDSKIIFLGDRYQLAPINETKSVALDSEYLKSNFGLKGFEITLTEVMRQKSDSLILQNAVKIRIAIENQADLQDFTPNTRLANIYCGVEEYVKNFQEKGADNAIAVGCTHKINLFFNDLARQKFYGKKAQMIEIGDYLLVTSTYERNGRKLYSGDHVIVHNFDLGNIETVAGIKFMPVELKLVGGTEKDNQTIIDLIRLDLLRLPSGSNLLHIESGLRHDRLAKNPIFRESLHPKDDKYIGALRLTYGHAITCNKAQGGEWNTVFVNMSKVPNLNWLYTSVTRAQEQLAIF